ncbi:Legume lectin domain [Dillenia turbinata]|uniref:non-specific serine/threonine protein kinase n=1 Tax=Dillenia turbinata TaxID=194707 RepID=A0AAN8ZQG0_9MAGN
MLPSIQQVMVKKQATCSLILQLHISCRLLVPFTIFFFFTPSISSATLLSFNFAYFDPNIRDISYEGNSTSIYPVIQLTSVYQLQNASSGRATYAEPMHLWDKSSGMLADFSTHFTFSIDSQGKTPYADGLTFFLQPNGSHLPTPWLGAAIGLASGDELFNSTDDPFVAVEFDTFQNTWDPPHEHVGININSMISVTNVSWSTNITNAQRYDAWITYNSSTKVLEAVFTNYNNSSTFKRKLSQVIDMRDYLPEWVTFGFSAATGLYFELHTIYSWEFSSNLPIDGDKTNQTEPPVLSPDVAPLPKSKSKIGLVAGLIGGSCVVIGFLGLCWFILWRKKREEEEDDPTLNMSMDDDFEKGTGPKKFSYNELARATNKFSEEEKLGEGGFGGVYRGYLRDLNAFVAVKRVSRNSKQGLKEYVSEVRIISRLRHRNLVQLIGWCHEKKELLLVYEFMPNGSLYSHLFKERSLTWEIRYKIARGLASALLYLHEEGEQCVLHRDIKSSNIMLDSNFNAKLGDFGLARLVDHLKGSQTTVVAGTMGYMAPECAMTSQASKESDVYSFGIVALEIACGRKPIDPVAEGRQIRMVEWVWELYGMGKIFDAVDPKLSANFDESQTERLMIVGLWCAHPDFSLRPSIRQAIQVLNFEAPLPILPSKMPVATYYAPPLNMALFSSPGGTSSLEMVLTQSSSYSNHTYSSNATSSSGASSPSTSLLHTQR